MAENSKALENLKEDFAHFCEILDRCSWGNKYSAGGCRAAYGSGYSVIERFKKENKNGGFKDTEYNALTYTFEVDPFIKAFKRLRALAVHIEIAVLGLRTDSGERFKLPIDATAGAVFAAPTVTLIDTEKIDRTIDHQKELERARRLMGEAIQRAQASRV
jgi:hypothetical protein